MPKHWEGFERYKTSKRDVLLHLFDSEVRIEFNRGNIIVRMYRKETESFLSIFLNQRPQSS